MKNKKIIFLIIILVIIFIFNLKLYAITLPWLSISSNNYSNGDKVNLEENNVVEVEKTLQLYGMIIYGNDVYDPEYPDSMGRYVEETYLSGVTWTSSNNGIATVDNKGKVTGVAEGKATITAEYDGESANYEINVKPKSNSEFTGLVLADKNLSTQSVFVLNKEYGFPIYLNNIPNTEKENIKVTMDDESVVTLTGIDLCDSEDSSEKSMIIANVKFLSLGEFTITATLNYNGKVYSETYTNKVVQSRYTISLSTKEYTNLPKILEVGDKIQLTATLGQDGTELMEDITENGVTWLSSNEKIATVDKGLVSAKGEGKVTITAKYTGTDDSVIETYDINITSPTKTPDTTNQNTSTDSTSSNNDPTKATTTLPQTGENPIIIIIGFGLISLILIIIYIKCKKYKDMK